MGHSHGALPICLSRLPWSTILAAKFFLRIPVHYTLRHWPPDPLTLPDDEMPSVVSKTTMRVLARRPGSAASAHYGRAELRQQAGFFDGERRVAASSGPAPRRARDATAPLTGDQSVPAQDPIDSPLNAPVNDQKAVQLQALPVDLLLCGTARWRGGDVGDHKVCRCA